MESISLKNDTFLRDYIKNNLMKKHKTLGQSLQIDTSDVKELQKELFCELFDNYGIYEIDKIANEMGYPYDSIFIKKRLNVKLIKLLKKEEIRSLNNNI